MHRPVFLHTDKEFARCQTDVSLKNATLVSSTHSALSRDHCAGKLPVGVNHAMSKHRLGQGQSCWQRARIIRDVAGFAIAMMIKQDWWQPATELHQRMTLIAEHRQIALV